MSRRRGVEDIWSDDSAPTDGIPENELTPKRAKWIAKATEDPMLYLYGKDPETKTPIIRTLDAFDLKNKIKPLPTKDGKPWPVHADLIDHIAVKRTQRIAIEKVRQVMLSWFAIVLLDWQCRMHQYQRTIFMKSVDDESRKVLGDRWELIDKHMPAWLKLHSPGRWNKTDGTVTFSSMNSVIMTAGENLDEREARGDQIDVAVIDECALHPRLKEILTALEPMAYQIILITTPQHGQAGAVTFERIVTEGLKSEEDDE